MVESEMKRKKLRKNRTPFDVDNFCFKYSLERNSKYCSMQQSKVLNSSGSLILKTDCLHWKQHSTNNEN